MANGSKGVHGFNEFIIIILGFLTVVALFGLFLIPWGIKNWNEALNTGSGYESEYTTVHNPSRGYRPGYVKPARVPVGNRYFQFNRRKNQKPRQNCVAVTTFKGRHTNTTRYHCPRR